MALFKCDQPVSFTKDITSEKSWSQQHYNVSQKDFDYEFTNQITAIEFYFDIDSWTSSNYGSARLEIYVDGVLFDTKSASSDPSNNYNWKGNIQMKTLKIRAFRTSGHTYISPVGIYVTYYK